jgi:holo-[acyl-carrier protein] synthase
MSAQRATPKEPQMIVGHGVDVQDISRIRKILSFSEEDFLIATFTKAERSIEHGGQEHAEFLAGRLAAKEAVVKALGTGFAGDIACRHVEILRREGGQPEARLSGAAREASDALGITRWLVSISHSEVSAFASAIAVQD